MTTTYRASASRAAKYDYLIKLLLIGDSGESMQQLSLIVNADLLTAHTSFSLYFWL